MTGRRPEHIVIAVVLFAAAGLGLIRVFASGPAESPLEKAAAGVAFAAVIAAPALLAGAAHRRPGLLLAAGLGLVPLALLSAAGLTLPLVIPAVALLVLHRRRTRETNDRRRSSIRVGAAALVTVNGLVLALLALLVHDDPRSWTRTAAGQTIVADSLNGGSRLPPGTSSGSVSDVVTLSESAISLALVAITVVAALAIAGTTSPSPISRATAGADRAGDPATPRR